MAMILDGKAIAKKFRETTDGVNRMFDSCVVRPCLGIVLCTNDPASEIYVKRKIAACKEVGITTYLIRPFEGGVENWNDPTGHLLKTIDYLNDDPSINGIMVQLPLHDQSIQNFVFDRINPLKDVDVFNPVNVGLLLQGRPRFVPCTPQAIQELVIQSGLNFIGKKVAVINRSNIVGKPLTALLIQDNVRANATVVTCHDQTPPERLRDVCLASDIVVVAVGKPGFLTPDMVHERSIVIDVGITRVDGKILGDVDHSVYDKVAAYSPVPGGCGPMTVAMLLRNVFKAYGLQKDQTI